MLPSYPTIRRYDELLGCLEHLMTEAGNAGLMTAGFCQTLCDMAGRFILMPGDPRFGTHHHAVGLECSALLQEEGGFIVSSCHQLEE